MIETYFFSKEYTDEPIDRSKVKKEEKAKTVNISTKTLSESKEGIEPHNKKISNIEKEEEKNNMIEELKSINNIKDFEEYVEGMDSEFKGPGINTVIYDGNLESKILVIGEAPGHMENIKRQPFIGDSGKILMEALSYIDLDRSKVIITNVIYWQPPKNRTPTNEEIEKYKPLLFKFIELTQPKVILLVGNIASKALLSPKEGITKLRNKVHDYNGIQVVCTFHPSFLMRMGQTSKYIETDMYLLKNIISRI